MQNIPDNKNWWGNVDQLMRTYKIDLNEDQIQELSSRSFKNIVKRAIKDFAFKQLKNECILQSKTKEICYRDFNIQPYLKEINPNLSKLIIQARSKTLDIKDHLTYKYQDKNCRWCGIGEETVQHITNCGSDLDTIDNVENIINNGSDITTLKIIALRIEEFLNKICD